MPFWAKITVAGRRVHDSCFKGFSPSPVVSDLPSQSVSPGHRQSTRVYMFRTIFINFLIFTVLNLYSINIMQWKDHFPKIYSHFHWCLIALLEDIFFRDVITLKKFKLIKLCADNVIPLLYSLHSTQKCKFMIIYDFLLSVNVRPLPNGRQKVT